jgi:hypothetical protein
VTKNANLIPTVKGAVTMKHGRMAATTGESKGSAKLAMILLPV